MRPCLTCLLVLTVLAAAHAQKPPDKPPQPRPARGPVHGTLDTGGHTTPVGGLAFTPDGKQLVSIDHTAVYVWSTATGERERTWRLPTLLDTLAVSPDGKTVAVAAGLQWEDNERFTPVWLLDLASGDSHWIRLPAAYGIASLAFSPDGRRLAWNTWYQAGVWGLRANQLTHLLSRGADPGRVAFGKDGDQLLDVWPVYDKFQAQVWDVSPRPGKRPLEPKQPLFEVKGAGLLLAWAPDGSRFADWDKDRGALRLWTADGKREKAEGGTGPRLIPLRGGLEPDLLQFLSPDRLAVVAAGNERIRLSFVNVQTGAVERVRNWPLPSQDALHVAVSPDGKFLAATSTPGYQVVLFDVDAPRAVRRLGTSFRVPTGVGWLPDSRSIAWGFNTEGETRPERGLNLATLEPLKGPQLQGFKGFWQPKGWSIEFEDEDKRAKKTRGLTLVRNGKRIETDLDSPAGPYTFYKDAGGKLGLAVVNHWGNGDLSLIDGATGKVTLVAWATFATDVSVSPDGKFLLLARENQALDVYRLDGKPGLLLRVLVAGADWIAWTPRGYYAATPAAERLMGWTSKKDDQTPLTFYPAERFRKQLYRPEVLKLVLDKGGVGPALQAADALLGQAPADTDVKQLLPPRATLEVVDRSGLDRGKVKVRATADAAVKDQPVRSLQLWVDGRPLAGAATGKGLEELPGGQAKAEVVWNVELPPGEHELTVLARGPDTAGASDAVRVTVPLVVKERPTLHLLAVGIDNYRDKDLQLNFAAKDAEDLADAFRTSCTGDGNLFGAVKRRTLRDDQATRQGVRDAVGDVRQAAKAGDLVVVYFAGHGVKEKGDFYLLTVEADTTKLAETTLSGKELRKQLGEMPCQVLLILDACHSAAGVKAFKSASDDAARSLSDDECAVAVLCAAMGQEYALEDKGNGLFTRALVQALRKTRDVPYNHRDGRQYVHHLHTFVFEEVQAASNDKQHPFLSLPWVTQPFAVRRLPER